MVLKFCKFIATCLKVGNNNFTQVEFMETLVTGNIALPRFQEI